MVFFCTFPGGRKIGFDGKYFIISALKRRKMAFKRGHCMQCNCVQNILTAIFGEWFERDKNVSNLGTEGIAQVTENCFIGLTEPF